MTPREFTTDILDSAVTWCQAIAGWNVPFDDRARLMLTAISGQEANWTDRVQGGKGPAHGLFQFERGGGVTGVLHNPVTVHLAIGACVKSGIPANPVAAWGALATAAHDNLAVAFARLLLWSDPAPLPNIGDEDTAYEYYLRLWKPGKPSRKRWSVVYPQAMTAIQAKGRV
jgi:hypothetical protein